LSWSNGPGLGFFRRAPGGHRRRLWEFYNLARRRRWRPQRALGLLLALIVGSPSISRLYPEPGDLPRPAHWRRIFPHRLQLAGKGRRLPPSLRLTYMGAFYVALPTNYLYWIRLGHGQAHLYFFFGVIFLGDTGAYLIGKAFGRHKMAPIASPNKTWEGCAGGLLFALIASLAARFLFSPPCRSCGPPSPASWSMPPPRSAIRSNPFSSAPWGSRIPPTSCRPWRLP